ncbi:T9SS type A sorting domain-containing protein [Hyunsoonleella aestuarii]|uniref:T9SS type A sorting domain-containing protein n=1 Tax=Hyunsoonleella aestuarii TaxID=912802 RepID=A0ABP8EBF5_9FLAO|nr:T9SS type A sorting domain-containing protein [Hyunsoonleella aestuarii]
MKTILLLFLLFFLGAQAQTTQTITIDWGFNSTPTASGNANTDRTIEVGDTVEWNWYASGSHNVVSDGGTESFDSGSTTSNPGINFSFTFNQIGTTDFICEPHSSIMFGTITVVSEGTLSIQELNYLSNISIYPNPASSRLNLSWPKSIDDIDVEIYNVIGTKILHSKVLHSNSSINIDFLPKGFYIASIIVNDINLSRRFIKN